MTNSLESPVIVLANHALARRKRARHFWGTMGVLLRFDGRRDVRADGRVSGASAARGGRKSAFETRAPRAG